MQTRSSSRLISDQSSNPTSFTNPNPKGRNCRRSKQQIENSNLEEHSHPIVTMSDQRTMAELLRAPTEGYAEAIVVPPILAEQFELKHCLINMMTTDQFFGLEKDNPHDHIRWFNKITSTIKYKDVPSSAIKLMLFPFSLAEAAHQWLEKEPPRSIHTWEDLISKFINELFPSSRTTNLPPVKAVEEICVTCGGAHPYYQCLAARGNTFPELKDNIQGYVSATAVNYNHGNPCYRPPARRLNEANMKAMQTQIDMVKNELRNEMKSSIQTSLSNQTNEIKNMMASLLQMNTGSTSGSGSLPSNTVANPKGELKAITTRSEETFTDPDLTEYTINVLPPPVQKYKFPSQREFVVQKRDPLHPNIPYPSRMLKQKQQEKDEVQIHKFWQMFKQLHINITLADALILMPNELKCKALADLGASINLMPLSVWKKLGLPELIPTSMTFELANRAICTPAGIARDVFVLVGKFTFPADFVIVDYESDPRVPLILERPFLRTARALIDVHGEEMILRNGDKRLILNMRHDTSSYSNQPQKESINLINVFNNSSEDFLDDLFSNQPSGNPTFLLHPELTSLEVNNDIFDSEGCNVLSKKLLDLDSTKDLNLPIHDNPLSGSTTYFFNPLLEEFADEPPPEYNDNLRFDIESDLKEIEILLYQDKDSSLKDLIDQKDLVNLADILVDSVPEMFTDEPALDYSSPPIFDVYDDDFLEVESDAGNVYDDPFDSKGEKIKEVDALPSTNNEDKIFNPGILIQEKSVEIIITRVVQDKKLAISNASLVLEDFDPPFYEPLFFKEVPKSKMPLPFSSENEKKVFKPGIHTSEKVHYYFIPELSHQGYKVYKINNIFKSPMQIFLFYCGKDNHILAVFLSPLLPP
uniref:Reverse transcriptase domain-containing protein n=1 Tax=Tanacetum cinerariifolium TaxID=118510 RepID=A0A6L2LK25_TANCI|nr:hypothetical protein [Tanacetum cinerariifolium]